MISLAPSPHKIGTSVNGYNTAPAVSPIATCIYANRDTKAYEAWNAEAAHVARIVTESTLETEALREQLLAIAVSE
jgi:hypothetical protein